MFSLKGKKTAFSLFSANKAANSVSFEKPGLRSKARRFNSSYRKIKFRHDKIRGICR